MWQLMRHCFPVEILSAELFRYLPLQAASVAAVTSNLVLDASKNDDVGHQNL
jgi:hypothetical protein